MTAILVVAMACGAAMAADTGETIFKAQGCASCHQAAKSTSVNPSLQDIAQSYNGKETDLIRYLQGEAESVVRPEKAGMMKRQIEKTRALSEADRKALADFIMSHGN
jgi:cytochrome c